MEVFEVVVFSSSDEVTSNHRLGRKEAYKFFGIARPLAKL
jgi:hypothetical protein